MYMGVVLVSTCRSTELMLVSETVQILSALFIGGFVGGLGLSINPQTRRRIERILSLAGTAIIATAVVHGQAVLSPSEAGPLLRYIGVPGAIITGWVVGNIVSYSLRVPGTSNGNGRVSAE